MCVCLQYNCVLVSQPNHLANLLKSIVFLLAVINRLAKIQIHGYIRYPGSKNYWYPN